MHTNTVKNGIRNDLVSHKYVEKTGLKCIYKKMKRKKNVKS